MLLNIIYVDAIPYFPFLFGPSTYAFSHFSKKISTALVSKNSENLISIYEDSKYMLTEMNNLQNNQKELYNIYLSGEQQTSKKMLLRNRN